MSAPVFEVTLDHNDPAHHDSLDRVARDLYAWARRHRCMQVIREERTVRPGVVQLRFFPDPQARRVVPGDRLILTPR